MLLAHAAAGDVEKVEQALDQEAQESPAGQVSSQSLASVAEGYLRAGCLPSAKLKLEEMRESGFQVPPHVFDDWAFRAGKEGCLPTVVAWMDEFSVPLTDNIFTGLLKGCSRSDEAQFVAALEQRAVAERLPVSGAALMAMLQFRAKVNDGRARETVKMMKELGFKGTTSFWDRILSACVASENIKCAAAVHAYLSKTSATTPHAYRCLIQLHGCAGHCDQVCDLCEELRAAGMDLESDMLPCLLTCASKGGRTQLAKEMSGKGANHGQSVKKNTRLNRTARKARDPAQALRALGHFRAAHPGRADAGVYTAAILACSCSKDMAAAERLAGEMRAEHGATKAMYDALIKGHCLSGDLAAGGRALQRLEADGFTPDAESFVWIMNLAARSFDMKAIWDTLENMDRFGIPLQQTSASLLMQAARAAPKFKDGCRLLTLLDRGEIDVTGDELIFNAVLDACIYLEDKLRLARTVHLYRFAAFAPSARTYSLLIQACTMLTCTQRCLDLWEELTARSDITVSGGLVGDMIAALIDGSQVSAAFELFQGWRNKVDCDEETLCMIARGFAHMRDAGKAMAVYGDMKARGYKMDVATYNHVINANCRQGSTSRAEAVLEDALASGCTPLPWVCARLIRGYCHGGLPRCALRVVRAIADKDPAADHLIYSALLDGCAHSKEFHVADELLEFMKERKVAQSTCTLSAVLTMWSLRGDLDKAFEALDAARADEAGRTFDAQVVACIIRACFRNDAPDRALKAFEDLKRSQSSVDLASYNALIGELALRGRSRQSAKIAEEACEYCLAGPDEDPRNIDKGALRQMYQALRQDGLLEEIGHPLFQKLEAAGQRTNHRWLNPVAPVAA
uniref:Pentatricopeptide repeat-containing protein-mitochondrial domain-containing protein n=1 Tax=Zooxanthella nutricula TaxID=1333877 RepID=A0A7S2J029_9DINO